MGASAWFAVTAHSEDLQEALRNAKRKVFEARDFHDALGILQNPAAAAEKLQHVDFPPGFPEKVAQGVRAATAERVAPQLEAIEELQTKTDVDDKIDALRRAVGFAGTHSIIDIPSTTALTRVEDEELVHRFNTERPTLSAVREASTELTSLVHERFCAVWLVADDENGTPWTCFVGVSGD